MPAEVSAAEGNNFLADDFAGNINLDDLGGSPERRAELREAAERYVTMGWRIIPLHDVTMGSCSCGAAPGECAAGKHPVENGWQKPREDAQADSRWWRDTEGQSYPADSRPDANIGILTGIHSGIFVADIDKAGEEKWEQLGEKHADDPLPDTRLVETGSGGRHWVFPMPSFPVGNPKPWGAGIDIKGTGGYVVAPPSISGKGEYALIRDAPPGEAPEWILQPLRERLRQMEGRQSSFAAPVAPAPVLRNYVKGAFRGEIRKITEAPKGERNQKYFEAAANIAELAAHGLVSREEAYAVLSEAGRRAGLGDNNEIEGSFRSGWNRGIMQPRDLSRVGEITDHEWPLRPWDEGGNGDRVVDHIGNILKYSDDLESWMEWQNGIWRPVSRIRARSRAWHVIEMLPYTEALQYPDEGGPREDDDEDGGAPRARFLKWHAKQRANAAANNAAEAAIRHSSMNIRKEMLDAGAFHLNVRNGMLDCETRQFYAHEPEQLMTMQANVLYDPQAQCPTWDDFLAQVQPDPEIRQYLYRIWGYSLTASLAEQAIFLHHGSGANGKSVANDVITSIAGTYAQTVPVETLILSSKTGGVPNDIARMDGRRFLSASETKAGKQLNEALVKQLTGGDTIAARLLHKEFFEFKMKGKIHLISNHLVHLSADSATHRRIHLIRWGHTIPDKDQDKNLGARIIREESSGVLNRLLEGLRDWRERGDLAMPAVAQEAKQEYIRDEDWRNAFLEACCEEVPPQEWAPGRSLSELYAVYVLWHQQAQPGGRPLSKRGFGDQLDLPASPRARLNKWENGKTVRWTGFPTLQVRQNPDL
jgi:putative DNA primase/helicase